MGEVFNGLKKQYRIDKMYTINIKICNPCDVFIDYFFILFLFFYFF